MPRYIKLGTGQKTDRDDPERGVWYAANQCGYWTDDWDLLDRIVPEGKPLDPRTAGWKNGIPCCPYCKTPGMQVRYSEWMAKAVAADESRPRYSEFLLLHKERCCNWTKRTFLQAYESYVKDDHDHSQDVPAGSGG